MAAPVAVRVTYPTAGILNITPEVLRVSVRRGAFFDPGSGTFSLLSAEGVVNLDTSRGRFDRYGGYAGENEYDNLLDIQYSVRDRLRWRGEAVARPCVRLHRAPPLAWDLRAKHWQPLRRPLSWLQDPTHSTLADVFDDMVATAGAPGAVGASKFPAGARLASARSVGTLAATINAMALTTGCIPVEGNDGALALHDISAIQPITSYVAGQNATTRASTLEREPVIQQRLLQLFGTATDEEPTATLASATRYGTAAYFVAATYLWPDDVEDVVWDTPTADWVSDPGGGDQVTVHAETFKVLNSTGDPRRTYLAVIVTADLDDNYTVEFRGRVYRRLSYDGALLKAGDPPDTAETLQTQDWLDLQHASFTPDAQAVFVGVINAPMIMGRIRIPLDTAAKAAANWRPGYWAAFKAGNFNLDMLVLNLTDEWAVGQEPYVDVEGIVTAIVNVTTGTGISGSTWGRDATAVAPPLPDAAGAPTVPLNLTVEDLFNGTRVDRVGWDPPAMGDTPIVYYVEQELRGLPPGTDRERKVVAEGISFTHYFAPHPDGEGPFRYRVRALTPYVGSSPWTDWSVAPPSSTTWVCNFDSFGFGVRPSQPQPTNNTHFWIFNQGVPGNTCLLRVKNNDAGYPDLVAAYPGGVEATITTSITWLGGGFVATITDTPQIVADKWEFGSDDLGVVPQTLPFWDGTLPVTVRIDV